MERIKMKKDHKNFKLFFKQTYANEKFFEWAFSFLTSGELTNNKKI